MNAAVLEFGFVLFSAVIAARDRYEFIITATLLPKQVRIRARRGSHGVRSGAQTTLKTTSVSVCNKVHCTPKMPTAKY
jgi:hypothetical protein